MNAWNERGSDSDNFGERITEFEVTVAKIWQKEVIGTYLQFLEVARGIFGIIFEIRGASCECVDYRLIMENGRGVICKTGISLD
jgi:hypothetical protein